MQKYIKSGIEISELGLGCMSLGTEYHHAEKLLSVQLKMVSHILIPQIFMIEGSMKTLLESL